MIRDYIFLISFPEKSLHTLSNYIRFSISLSVFMCYSNMLLFMSTILSIIYNQIWNLQRSHISRSAMAFTRNVMAASTVSATAHLTAVLSVTIRRTLLLTKLAGPTLGTHALAVKRLARGPVLALAIHLAISAPFTQRALCSYEN